MFETTNQHLDDLAAEELLEHSSIPPMDINWFIISAVWERADWRCTRTTWSFRYLATLVLFGLTVFPSVDRFRTTNQILMIIFPTKDPNNIW